MRDVLQAATFNHLILNLNIEFHARSLVKSDDFILAELSHARGVMETPATEQISNYSIPLHTSAQVA
jgi:hypothetical protein